MSQRTCGTEAKPAFRYITLATFALAMLAIVGRPAGAAQLQESDETAVRLTVKRGLTGQLNFSHPSPTLRALPDQSMDAPVLVRLERSLQEPANADRHASSNGANNPQGRHHYTLWFFGTVAGEYDLSRWVVQKDGSPLTANEALPRMNVRVVSELPPGHGTSLYEIDDPTLRAPGGYRAALITFACLWAVVPFAWAVVRWRARQPSPPEPVVRAPTLADRLRPLVERASQGRLTVDEQSRLEFLLYVFWQRRLGLPESMVDALPMLRRHADAGSLLRTLEAWIHADAPVKPNLSQSTMDALLAPYHASLESSLEHNLSSAAAGVSGGQA